MVRPIIPGPQHTAQVEIGLDARLLDVVKSVVIGLPDIDLGPAYGVAVGIQNSSVNPQRSTFFIQTDVCLHRQFRCIGDVERPQRCFRWRLRVCGC